MLSSDVDSLVYSQYRHYLFSSQRLCQQTAGTSLKKVNELTYYLMALSVIGL